MKPTFILPAIIFTFAALAEAEPVRRVGSSRTIRIGEKPTELKQIGADIKRPTSKPPTIKPYDWLKPFADESRMWTSAKGSTIEARLVRFNRYTIVLQSSTNRPISVARSILSIEDNALLSGIEEQRNAELSSKWKAEQKEVAKRQASRSMFKTGCPNCDGTGWVKRRVAPITLAGALKRKMPTLKVESKVPCSYCDNTGRYSRDNTGTVPQGHFSCQFCGGKGCDWCNWIGHRKLNQPVNEASNPFAGSGR